MQPPPSLPFLFVCFLNIGSPSVHFLYDNLPCFLFILCSVAILDTDRNALTGEEEVWMASLDPARRGAPGGSRHRPGCPRPICPARGPSARPSRPLPVQSALGVMRLPITFKFTEHILSWLFLVTKPLLSRSNTIFGCSRFLPCCQWWRMRGWGVC